MNDNNDTTATMENHTLDLTSKEVKSAPKKNKSKPRKKKSIKRKPEKVRKWKEDPRPPLPLGRLSPSIRRAPLLPWLIQPKNESTCQIVTLVNAYKFYGIEPPYMPGTQAWEDLKDLTASRHGSVIYRERLYEAFGVLTVPLESTDEIFRHVKAGVPVDVSVWNEHMGLHSALAIRVSKVSDQIEMVNVYGRKGNPTKWFHRQEFEIERPEGKAVRKQQAIIIKP